MRHEQQRALVATQKVFQPLDGFDVEVVGRFIQHENIRIADQRLRQQDAALLSARKLIEPPRVFQPNPRNGFIDRLVRVPIIVRILKPLKNQFLDRSCHLMRHILPKAAHLQTRLADDFAGLRFEVAIDDLQ